MNKKYLVYVPLLLILLIQIFDNNDQFLTLQYLLLGLLIIVLILKLVKK